MDLRSFDTIIDCRSPSEYAEDHIPGAISAPVLDDAERAAVGTVYKERSPFEAKKLGGALVAKNVARHVETLFAGKGSGWRPLVYCWRGGKRSGAMAHILREIGWDAQTLPGGYRRYRKWVVEALQPGLPVVADARFVHDAEQLSRAEFALAVADDWQGRGLGRRLMAHLIAEARRQGYSERQVFTVSGAYFDWAPVIAASQAMSLFADKQLI